MCYKFTKNVAHLLSRPNCLSRHNFLAFCFSGKKSFKMWKKKVFSGFFKARRYRSLDEENWVFSSGHEETCTPETQIKLRLNVVVRFRTSVVCSKCQNLACTFLSMVNKSKPERYETDEIHVTRDPGPMSSQSASSRSKQQSLVVHTFNRD